MTLAKKFTIGKFVLIAGYDMMIARTEMIEKVAQAMVDKAAERGFKIPAVVVYHLAVAAMEALREPTDEMCDAANELDTVSNGLLVTPVPYHAWRAMIDVALGKDARG